MIRDQTPQVYPPACGSLRRANSTITTCTAPLRKLSLDKQRSCGVKLHDQIVKETNKPVLAKSSRLILLFEGKMRKNTLLILACTIICITGCRRTKPVHPDLPSVTKVQAALSQVQGQSPYKSFVVDRLEPLGQGRFAVLFLSPDPSYRGSGTSVPLPLHGYVTNNGYIVNCILVDSEGKSVAKGEEVLIPFEQ